MNKVKLLLESINIEKYKKTFTIEDLKKKISSYKNYLKFKDKLKENNYLNTSAFLISQSLSEMELFVDFLKGNEKTVYGLAGLGDLFVSSQGGRNSKMGEYLGQGMTFKEAKKTKMP